MPSLGVLYSNSKNPSRKRKGEIYLSNFQTHCASCGRSFHNLSYWCGYVDNGKFCEDCRKKWVKFAREHGLKFDSPLNAAIIGFEWSRRNEHSKINVKVRELWDEFVHNGSVHNKDKEKVLFT